MLKSCTDCHAAPIAQEMSATEKLVLHVVETISLVAVSILAAYKSPKYFFPALGLSFLYSLSVKPHAHFDENQSVPSCSLGYLEQLSKTPYPVGIRLLFNFGIFVDHLCDHHSIYSVMAATSLGLLCGHKVHVLKSRYFKNTQV